MIEFVLGFFMGMGFWFWGLVLIEFCLLTWFVEMEWGAASFVSLGIFILGIWWLADVPVWQWVKTNPWQLLKYALIYIVAGLAWSIGKYYFVLRKIRNFVKNCKKEWTKKINVRERRKAIRAALAATLDQEIVTKRGHFLPQSYPFALDDSFESLAKTKDVLAALQKLGFEQEIKRAEVTTTRAGIGKRRGRRKVTKKSFLFVVSKDCPLLKAAANITGVDIVPVQSLNAELLAPGAHPGPRR